MHFYEVPSVYYTCFQDCLWGLLFLLYSLYFTYFIDLIISQDFFVCVALASAFSHSYKILISLSFHLLEKH